MKANELLNTKKKKIVAGCVAGGAVLCGGLCYALFGQNEGQLVFTTHDLQVEFGNRVSTDVADYLDYDRVNEKDVQDIIQYTKVKDNLKNVIIQTRDEQGNVIAKEEKDYPKVGKYTLTFTYKDETESVKVSVADTIKPKIKVPESINILQYTDLSAFHFNELLKATDYSNVTDWKIDTSKVDVNTVGEYELKVSISDQYKNKASKTMKVHIVAAPAVAEGEVAVTEIVTDDNGNKKTVVTKKSSGSVSSTDSVSTGKPVENKDQIKNSSDGSASKPSNSSGTTGGNTGGNSGSSSSNPSVPVHSHNWVAVTKTVHHDAVTKVVHHDAVTKAVHHDAVTKTVTVTDKEAWDEPVYEGGYYICNRCGYHTKDGAEITIHTVDVCGGGWHVGKVVVNTIHHPAETHTETKVVTPAWDETVVVKVAWDETVVVKAAYDETVVTGYRCSSCGATK